MTFKHILAALLATASLVIMLPFLEYSLAVLPFTWQHTFATGFTSHPILIKGSINALYLATHPTWQNTLSMALLGQGKIGLVDIIYGLTAWCICYTTTASALDFLYATLHSQQLFVGTLGRQDVPKNKGWSS